MEDSTLTKAPAKSKATSTTAIKKENENIMQHIVDMNERISYLMDALKNQAEMVQSDHAVLERIRNRMGM